MNINLIYTNNEKIISNIITHAVYVRCQRTGRVRY